jgi:hypothetical protein
LPFGWDYDEALISNQKKYDSVIVGKTSVTMEVHSGALGIPWYHVVKREEG